MTDNIIPFPRSALSLGLLEDKFAVMPNSIAKPTEGYFGRCRCHTGDRPHGAECLRCGGVI